jgi:hypothetical protein
MTRTATSKQWAPAGTTAAQVGLDGRVHFSGDFGEIVRDDIPGVKLSSGRRFRELPEALGSQTAEELARHYFKLLDSVVVCAIAWFGHLP